MVILLGMVYNNKRLLIYLWRKDIKNSLCYIILRISNKFNKEIVMIDNLMC
jgi:hypothetical protein